jgi:outer membrane protein assembly factor BamB
MRRYWLCLLVLSVPLCFLCSAQNQRVSAFDWPQWRGPQRDAVSQEKGLLPEWPTEGPSLVWNSKESNGGKSIGTGYSSVAISGGQIYTLGDRDGKCSVYCLDEKTGKHLWSTPLAQSGGDGPRSTPTVEGDRLYALTRHGVLACLSTKNGKILWKVDYKGDFNGRMMSGWDYSESVLLDGEKLLCTPGGDKAAVAALNKYTGEPIWQSEIRNCGGAGYASIVTADVGGIRQYITLFGRCIAGVRASDGKFLWRYDRVANGTANIPTPIVRGNLVFCSTAYGQGSALLKLVPTENGGVAAEELYFLPGRTLQNHHGGIIRVGDYIYGGHGHNDGQPFCVHMTSGKFAWGPERNGHGTGAVVYADGKLYFRYEDGTMMLVEATPEGFHPISSFQLPRNVGVHNWPHPVIANGRLYIRGNDMLLCYDVKAK